MFIGIGILCVHILIGAIFSNVAEQCSFKDCMK